MKPLSTTKWECRIDSIKAICYQIGEVYDALVEISEITNEPMEKAKAEFSANQLKDYKFCVSLIFWYELLFKVNYVSKELQGETKDINEGIESFKTLLSWLKNYREEGFNDVLLNYHRSLENFMIKRYVEGSECFCMKQRINLMMIQKKCTEFSAST